MSDLRFEVCVDSIRGIVAARDGGAARVELCAGLIEGGTTPSLGTVLVAREIQNIGVHMMIRPRGGDFLYGVEELVAMETDIATAKSAGVDGFVFGALDPDGKIDAKVTRRLIERARPASVTFHRAFDMVPDAMEALKTLIDLGVDRVLTSGLAPTAFEGAETIAELVKAAGDRIIVMPGGGITERNAARVVSITGAREFHFAALKPVPSGMRYRSPDMYMGGELRPPEYDRLDTQLQSVATIIGAAGKGGR
ncbi:copper homeostasis protein CutC [Bauldia litoralis]|uniref:PF03932 family protein CutC n=1 Tax=Bauldia litoralis TaxID=665467 RepID=A0A1G6DQ76_9HYPH|nr:copper homeostasis protein CutC [Bauldia litoralis]SDB47288.1 copper homeostasis protein [Bauldia litoralis]